MPIIKEPVEVTGWAYAKQEMGQWGFTSRFVYRCSYCLFLYVWTRAD